MSFYLFAVECHDSGPNDPVSSKKTILLSDSAHSQSPISWHKSSVGSRSGLPCNLEAVDAVHYDCQRAVLTCMSKFGNCIGEIKDVWIVRPDGACVRKEHIDLIGAGTLLV